jgi:hypothetical protein
MKLHMALFLYTLASTQVSQSVAPTLTADVLSSDRVAIYREFLISDPALAAVPATSTLNVSLVTEPFVYKDFVDPDRSLPRTVFAWSTFRCLRQPLRWLAMAWAPRRWACSIVPQRGRPRRCGLIHCLRCRRSYSTTRTVMPRFAIATARRGISRRGRRRCMNLTMGRGRRRSPTAASGTGRRH